MSLQNLEKSSLLTYLNESKVVFEVTVPTGLESVAESEIISKLDNSRVLCSIPGHVYFHAPSHSQYFYGNLRSVDNVSLVVSYADLEFINDKAADLVKIKSAAPVDMLSSCLKNWVTLTGCNRNVSPTKDEHDIAKKSDNDIEITKEFVTSDALSKSNILRFRVTCERIGKSHVFSSTEAATAFGGQLNDQFNWLVSLNNFDLNVLLKICDNKALVCYKLTSQSLHRRNLVSFGKTTLRPTIAFGLLSLANVEPGEIVLDPLCGSGSIAVECMHAFMDVFMLCGDIDSVPVTKTKENIDAQIDEKMKPFLFQWDATKLPILDQKVDVIVTDLPFGKRFGNKKENFQLFSKLTEEFARVLNPTKGRCVLLTKAKMPLLGTFKFHHNVSKWRLIKSQKVNVGNLACTVFILQLRNNADYQQSSQT